jgi:hypothetical protein
MRPVDKPNPPPNYPFIDVPSLQNHQVHFGAGSILVVYLSGPFDATVQWVQDELLSTGPLGQPFPNPATAQDVRRATALMRERLEALYRQAIFDLVSGIGAYCSFCEMRIPGHLLAVEHRAPKSLYPTYTVLWRNFLLVCRDCNSIKGSRPSRTINRVWTHLAHPTEDQRVTAIEDHYYWADLYAGTYRLFHRQYVYDTDTAAPVTLTAFELSSPLNRLVWQIGAVVQADVAVGAGVLNNRRVEVQIVNNGGIKGGHTLRLTGLDTPATPRASERTAVWLGLCMDMDTVLATVAQTNIVQRIAVFNGMWTMLLRHAVRTGFYSVWVDVLLNYAFPPGVLPGAFNSLGEKFVNDTLRAHNGDLTQVFPGTDDDMVP